MEERMEWEPWIQWGNWRECMNVWMSVRVSFSEQTGTIDGPTGMHVCVCAGQHEKQATGNYRRACKFCLFFLFSHLWIINQLFALSASPFILSIWPPSENICYANYPLYTTSPLIGQLHKPRSTAMFCRTVQVLSPKIKRSQLTPTIN